MVAKKSKTMKKQQRQEEVVEDDEVSTTSSTEAEDVANDDDDDDGSTSSDGSGESGSGESGSEESGSEDEMSVDNDEAKNDDNTKEEPSTITNDGNEACTFDLGNLLAFNTHQVNAAELYNQTTTNNNNNEWYNNTPTIANTNGSNTTANEAVLLAKAAEGTTQLLRELWKCPVEKKTDVGPLARLPSVDTKLPRALPPPPPKQLSKWEEFALQRGIAPKSKRSRKVFDESTGEWKHLTGSLETKANAGPESWPIMEVKKNDDPMADPWEKLREEKKGRVDKNVEARMRNAERTGVLDRGSANKFGKNAQRLAKQRDIAKEKERKRGLVAPVGVPLDVKRGEQRGKPSTQLALRATQVSTASLGKFDKQREGEPEKKLTTSIHGNKKRKQQLIDGSGGSGGGGNKSEAQKSADILNRVMSGGSSSKERERDVKKGKYARGETAHDYEYDDGLGASSFRKKKGRAGAGKIRKFTKKRIK
mmetsp:Transcript_25316/g.52932  ORF Transcript_25316/g.52932 Transcript_25316/m.52932 type:complete len:478 (-) Transcript_25316:171-1604(-)